MIPEDEVGGSVRILALLYRESLAEMGFGVGPVPMSESSPSPRSSTLAPPEEAFLAVVDRDGDVGAWSRTVILPETLDAYRIERSGACTGWVVETYALDTHRHPWTAVALDEQSALIVIGSEYFQVSRDGSTKIGPLVPGLSVTASFRRSADELWLTGAGGRLFRSVGTQFEEVPPSPVGETPGWIHGSPSNQELEIYTLTTDTIASFDGSTWSTHPGGKMSSSLGSLLWTAPREVIALQSTQTTVRRIKAGVETFERVGDGTAGLVASASVPGLGVIVGDVLGVLSRYFDGRWEPFGKPGAWIIRALCPAGGGFIAGGSFGWLAVYDREKGFCDLPVGPAPVSSIVPVGDDFLIAYENQQLNPEEGGPPTFYTWLRRAP